jgi:glutamine synthetase
MDPALTLDQLRTEISNERIDTVLLAFTDTQGRLQGTRVDGQRFLDAPQDGLVPDLGTLRRMPWHEKTALCLADPREATAPRRILRAQLERLSERGLEAVAATEVEFLVFKESYEDAAAKGYTGLTRIDHRALLGAARAEKLLGRIRREVGTLREGPALRAADEHVIYESGAKEIAALEGMSISFMAAYDERTSSGSRIELTLRGLDAGRASAGQLACLRELTLFYAPHANSYKRFADGPSLVSQGEASVLLAGADVNPYLALAALIASALHGLDRELGGASEAPRTLGEAAELFRRSQVAREAFGDEVVSHYVENARDELEAFEAAVTDWERDRGFA